MTEKCKGIRGPGNQDAGYQKIRDQEKQWQVFEKLWVRLKTHKLGGLT
jgi:hypothetical protein